jgi:DNA-directed RNA polymerase specialized sigma24 family protein
VAKTPSATLDDLLKQAKTTNRLIAAQLKSTMPQQALIKLLSTTDLTARDIADVLDTTPATVSVTLQRLRKKAKAKAEAGARADEGNQEAVVG